MSNNTQWQQRVIDERAELTQRMTSLYQWIASPEFLTLPADEQRLLLRQAMHMADYRAVLDERIARFKH